MNENFKDVKNIGLRSYFLKYISWWRIQTLPRNSVIHYLYQPHVEKFTHSQLHLCLPIQIGIVQQHSFEDCGYLTNP